MVIVAPWYVRNSNIHRDLNVPMAWHMDIFLMKLEIYPNPLSRDTLNFMNHIQMKRWNTTALASI